MLPSLRILLVEEDDHFAAVLRAELVGQGHVVEHAKSGSEAAHLAQASGSELDIILVEIRLRDGNGLELARRLRASAAPGSVIVSVSGSRLTQADSFDGIDLHLTKPVELDKLPSLLHYLHTRRPALQKSVT